MTALLEQAFTEAKKLTEQDQNVLAAIIIEEMLAERRWDDAFASSPTQLSKLADEALAAHTQGNTKPLQFN